MRRPQDQPPSGSARIRSNTACASGFTRENRRGSALKLNRRVPSGSMTPSKSQPNAASRSLSNVSACSPVRRSVATRSMTEIRPSDAMSTAQGPPGRTMPRPEKRSGSRAIATQSSTASGATCNASPSETLFRYIAGLRRMASTISQDVDETTLPPPRFPFAPSSIGNTSSSARR
jgi:hypothetical protein